MSFPHVLESKPQSVRNLHQAGLLAMFIWFFCQQAGGGYLDVVPFKFFWE